MLISIVICTYNREYIIEKALISLVNQTIGNEKFEIIVVNNGSTDNTIKIVNNFIEEHPLYKISLFSEEENKGLSHVRNRGVELAKGKYIAYIDDDARAERDYVENIIKNVMLYPNDVAFGGKVLPEYETGQEPKWMSQYIERVISIVNLGDRVKVLKKTYPVGCNMFFNVEILRKVGGFNTALSLRSDDKYIFYSLREKQYRILYIPEVVVYHFIDEYRTTLDYVKKISLLNGASERIRIKTSSNAKYKLTLKTIDFVSKLIASLLLWCSFGVKGEGVKGKALFLAMWYGLRGFLTLKK